LQALRAAAPLASITYVDATDPTAAAAIAKTADVVLVFAEQWRTEALDLETLHLDAGQDELIDAVASANPHTVVVVESGGPVVMPWLGKVGAVVESWYPGERGGEALARVLFGDVDASGRLPVTFPADVSQAPRPAIPGLAQVRVAAARSAASKPATFDLSGGVPSFPVDYPEGADVGYRWYQRQGAKPLFPFGFGLSYTRFAYGHLEIPAGPAMRVRFTVTNIGTRAGSDVPQIYATPDGAGAPTRRLVEFERVTLAPGETRTVEVTIDPRLLARFDAARHDWQPAKGSVAIEVGHDAGAIALTGVARPSP
jgi:beta-glucosidase